MPLPEVAMLLPKWSYATTPLGWLAATGKWSMLRSPSNGCRGGVCCPRKQRHTDLRPKCRFVHSCRLRPARTGPHISNELWPCRGHGYHPERLGQYPGHRLAAPRAMGDGVLRNAVCFDEVLNEQAMFRMKLGGTSMSGSISTISLVPSVWGPTRSAARWGGARNLGGIGLGSGRASAQSALFGAIGAAFRHMRSCRRHRYMFAQIREPCERRLPRPNWPPSDFVPAFPTPT